MFMIHLFFSYIRWHYGKALIEFSLNSKNFILFLFHFFSIKNLFYTLFAPWQSLGERYKKGIDISAFAEVFILNSIMRVVGFFIRLAVIVAGLITIFFSSILVCILFIFWNFLPLIIIFIFISGFRLLFS